MRSLPAWLLDKPESRDQRGRTARRPSELRARIPETGRRVAQRLQLCSPMPRARTCDKQSGEQIALLMKQKGSNGAANTRTHFRGWIIGDVPAMVRAVPKQPTSVCPSNCVLNGRFCGVAQRRTRAGCRWAKSIATRVGGRSPGAALQNRRRTSLRPVAANARNSRRGGCAPREAMRLDALVFPAPRGNGQRALSDMSLTRVLRFLMTGRTRDDGTPEMYGDLCVVHSAARSTFSTWANRRQYRAVRYHRDGTRTRRGRRGARCLQS